mmetsp:Transcript_88445/g.245591  ORF Transcript_88445/g.245591 Transcript_88445/m.245591 type:complete len:286 (+) Transcript_88445:470-1327(+)
MKTRKGAPSKEPLGCRSGSSTPTAARLAAPGRRKAARCTPAGASSSSSSSSSSSTSSSKPSKPPSPASSTATDPPRRWMARWRTGSCLSHQGQPWREKTISTCSCPSWMALVIEPRSRCCQPSSTWSSSELRCLGSATRTKAPSPRMTSSPLCGTPTDRPRAGSASSSGGSTPASGAAGKPERTRNDHGAMYPARRRAKAIHIHFDACSRRESRTTPTTAAVRPGSSCITSRGAASTRRRAATRPSTLRRASTPWGTGTPAGRPPSASASPWKSRKVRHMRSASS